jgi:O-antigen/teichoic acid export membrane protein
VLTVAIARQLGADELGTFSLVLATCLVFVNPLSYGLSLASTRSIAETSRFRLDRAVSAVVLIVSLGAVLIACFALLFLTIPDWLATKALGGSELGPLLRLGSILLVGEFFRKVGIGVFFGFRAYREHFLSTGVLSVGLLCLAFFARWFGIPGLLIGNGLVDLVAVAVGAVLVWRRFLSHRRLEFVLRVSLSERRILSQYVLPALSSSMLPAMVIWYVQVLLVRHGDSEQLGLFAASNQVRMAIVFVPAIVSSVLMPRLVRVEGAVAAEQAGVSKSIVLSVGGSVVAGAVLGAVLTSIAPSIAQAYGPDFLSHGALFVIMIWVGCLNGVNQALGTIIMSRGSMWLGFASNTVWAAVLAIMALTWIPDQLAMGVARAMLVAYGVITFLQVGFVVAISPEVIVAVRRLVGRVRGRPC